MHVGKADLHEDEGVEDHRIGLRQVIIMICLLLFLPLRITQQLNTPAHGLAPGLCQFYDTHSATCHASE